MKKFAMGLSVFVIGSLLFLGGYLILNKQVPSDQNENTPTPTIKPTINLEALTPPAVSPTPIKAWGVLKEDEKPTNISKEEAYEIYRQAVTSIYDRNYSLFTKLVSGQRVWRLQYKAITFLPFKQFGIGSYVEKTDSKKAFYDQILANMVYYSPAPESIVIDRIETNLNIPASTETLRYYNAEQNIDEIIFQNAYQNIINLYAHATTGDYFTAPESGKIVLVFEDYKWKFDWQFWTDKSIKGSDINFQKDFGDYVEKHVDIELDLDNRIKTNNFNLGNLSISSGETVCWNHAIGIIQSTKTNDSDANWNSPFLNFGNYYKTFSEKGSYPYQVIYKDQIFTGLIEVK